MRPITEAGCAAQSFPFHSSSPLLPSPPPQLIKKIINMGNFRSSAFQVCHFWSMRSGLLLAEKNSQAEADDIQYSSELDYNISEQRIAQSKVLWSVRAHEDNWRDVFATRNVRSFERGSLEVRSNDWVLISKSGQSCVGRVGEIVELIASGGSFVRLLLREARPIVQFDATTGGVFTVSRSVAAVEHVVDVESTSFHEVYCDDEHEGELRFTYIY